MSESIEQIREKAVALVNRMKADAEFRSQIEQEPESTLVAAGLPSNSISDFLTEMQGDIGEVSGYLMVGGCSVTCLCTTCCIHTS